MLKAPESRRNNIDAIRLLLALLVLFSHSFPLASGREESEPLNWFSGGQSTLGGLAVGWFFVLSGYLISQSWERSRTIWSFVKKRICRIYPGYVGLAIISIWLIVPLFGSRSDARQVYSWATVVANIRPVLLLQELFRAPAIFLNNPVPRVFNGSLWSISYEFKCYIGVVVLGLTTLLARRRLVAVIFLGAVTLSFLSSLSDLKPGWAALRPGGRHLPDFRAITFYLSGVVAYLYRERFRYDRRWAALALAGVVAGALIPCGFKLVLPTLGTYLLFYLAFTTDWSWHNAARYGDFSYGIYLYAWPIQQIVMEQLGRQVHPLTLFGLALGPTVLAGVLSWYLVERRFLRKAHEAPAPRQGTDRPAASPAGPGPQASASIG